MKQGTVGPTLNDLESSAERSKLNASLSRVRAGEVPAATLDIDVRLTQKELWPLFQILDKVSCYMEYFEKHRNKYVKQKFYAEKLNPPWWKLPTDDNTDNIVYDKFTINFAGYEALK